jgi:hypothetical protein
LDELPPPPGPEIEHFLAELERRWPLLEVDPESSPWGIRAALAADWERNRHEHPVVAS